MALPSSPPLLPEPDLPSSPISLPQGSSIKFPKNLKRQLSDYASQQSSDPVFSDTPSDAEQQLEQENQPKRKKQVKGPWWNVRRRESDRGLRRSLSTRKKLRNFDSGIWMGSDSSEESHTSTVPDQQHFAALHDDRDDDHEAVPDSEAIAVDFIRQCLDQGRECVDLTDLGLYSISNATLRPLRQLIRPSHEDLMEPPSEDEFVPFKPSIQLFLSRNSLSSLPTELFDLANLTVLSLRSNLLAKLPPAIGRLHSLQQLNVSGNCLEFLPWEFLELILCQPRQRIIIARPNPFVDPLDFSRVTPLLAQELSQSYLTKDVDRNIEAHQDLQNPQNDNGCLDILKGFHQSLFNVKHPGHRPEFCHHQIVYLASSIVRYFEVDGRPLRYPHTPSQPRADFSAVLDPVRHCPTSALATRVPSLYELSLRSLQSKFDLQDAAVNLSDHPLISHNVAANLKTAAIYAAELGNEKCSTCKKEMIIPRAQWMEYWFSGNAGRDAPARDTTFPFLRKACSWACARPTEAGEFHCCGG